MNVNEGISTKEVSLSRWHINEAKNLNDVEKITWSLINRISSGGEADLTNQVKISC